MQRSDLKLFVSPPLTINPTENSFLIFLLKDKLREYQHHMNIITEEKPKANNDRYLKIFRFSNLESIKKSSQIFQVQTILFIF